MSKKDAQRAQVLDRLKEDKISQQEAARQMGITPLQWTPPLSWELKAARNDNASELP